MISEEGEKVAFIETFNPKTAQGAVEKWLTQVRVWELDLNMLAQTAEYSRQ